MSWAPEVTTDDTGKWYSNAFRFATKKEAEVYASDLMYRWFAVRDTRVVESDDPVNYAIKDGQVVRLEENAH